MTELPELDARLSFEGDDFISAVNRFVQFDVIVKNIGSQPMPKIKIAIVAPNYIKIPIKVKNINYLLPDKVRNITFKIKPRSQGIFNCSVIIKRKETTLTTLPFKLKAGIIPAYQQPQPAIQAQAAKMTGLPKVDSSVKEEESISMIECPTCGNKIEEDSNFCPICGMILKEEKKEVQQLSICPNCGSSLIEGARFCSECGRKIE